MPETFINIMEFIVNFIEGAFAEASILLLLLGAVFLLLGLVILVLSLYIYFIGYRVDGKVLGAIKEVRIKEKINNGKLEKKVKENYFAVYEYQQKDGSIHQEKSSNGGNNILKYKTGQSLKLIVFPHQEYDDVYDVKDRSSFIMAGVFILIGVIIIERAASLYASLSLGLFTLFLILISFIVRLILGRKKKKKTLQTKTKHHKHFDVTDIRPVEDFARHDT